MRQLLSRLFRPASVLANQARTMVAALTTQVHVKAANLWRDLHNPLRGLTMSRAVAYLEDGERGAYADLQWLYRFIEKRDATLRGGKRSLLGAITEMDWDIKTVEAERLPPGWTEAQAKAQAVTLRTAYDRVSNLTTALEFLSLAEFRGYAHLEKIVTAGQITELRPVEQWYWCRDGLNGEWRYNATARPGRTQGDEVDLSRFVVREIDDPINEIALIAFVRKQLSRKDWDAFIESYGVPSIFAVMPQNVPQGREADYMDLAEKVIGDSRGALPAGSDIKTVDAGARGGAPFSQHLEALDKEIVLAITSGALTMLAESGTGTLAGGAHSETFMRVARALAKRITAAMQAQFDLHILATQHPGQPPLAYFEILTNEETDVGEVVKDVGSLKSAGLDVDASWVREKTGYPVTRAAAPTAATAALPNKAPAPTPAPATAPEPEESPDITQGMLEASLEALMGGLRADCAPLAARLQELLAEDMSDEDLMAGLELLKEDLPKLAAQVGGGKATLEAWEGILGAAMGNGLADDDTEEEDA